jgi:flagellar protein FliO/FliZ
MTKLIALSRASTKVVAITGFCLLAFACPAAAFKSISKAPGGENTPLNLPPVTSGSHASPTGGASIVRTIVGLAIVIAVIWGLAWILRQVKAGRDPQTPTAGLQSVAALTLSTGRAVHLVRVGEDYVLLGSAEHGVVPIQRYTAEQAREAGLLALDEPQPERSRIVAMAGQLLSPAREESYEHSPAVGYRTDPMRAPGPSGNVLDKLREWTVRR